MLGFRVWDIEEKSFIFPMQINLICTDAGNLAAIFCANGIQYANVSRFVAMQSTGIHDCSGKLIYEQDIIQVNLKEKIFRMFVGDVTEFLRQVGEWDAALQHDSDEHFEDIIMVYGNKFEQSELLEKSNARI